MLKNFLFILWFWGLVSCNAGPAHDFAPDLDHDAEQSIRQAFDQNAFDQNGMNRLLSGAVESGEVIGVSALVFDEGKIVYQNAFGLHDRERGKPVQLDTVFRIYSMTKPITAALIMDLVEEGKLALDDPASKYIPALETMKVARYENGGRIVLEDQIQPMTIEDLLLHRAGFGYGIYGPMTLVEAAYEQANLFDPRESLSQKIDKLTQLSLVAQPGEGWYYSYSMDVLGHIAEIVTGQSLGALLQERLFKPLGMVDTGFYVRADQKERFASNYQRDKNGMFTLQDDAQTSYYLRSDLPFESGGGGLVSTLDDYRRFAQMILQEGEFEGRRILEAKTVRAMLSNQMDEDDQYFTDWIGPDHHTGFGYGGFVGLSPKVEQTRETGLVSGQWGWSGMAKTQFTINPENNGFSIIMLQYFGEDNAPIRDRFRALVSEQIAD